MEDELDTLSGERKLSKKDYFVVSSLLFGLFFGAGNLIFPLHLGQIAGHNWLPATVGFLITAVALPLFSVLAIALTHAKGVYDIGLPIGTWFALVFMTLIHLTIGPFFGTPRTATVSFTVGISSFLPVQYQQLGLFIYSALFFLAAFIISFNESDILTLVGKVLNPAFLVLLFLVFVVAFASPMGKMSTAPATTAYASAGTSLMNGFLEGYNTMDALAGLAFGVTVVTAIRQLGKKKDSSVALVTAKSGTLSMSVVGLIYLLLIIVGAMSLGRFKATADGGTAFSQIVQSYAGMWGQALLAALIVLTCLTTAVGLVAAFAQDFNKHFPKVSYHVWLAVSCLASFTVANFGLETIISWSTPFLMFLYPISIVLIILSIGVKFFKKDRIVYSFGVGFTVIPAFLDLVVSMPTVISKSNFGLAVADFRDKLPLATYGLTWLVPMVVGLILGLVVSYLYKRFKKPVATQG